MPPKVVAKSRKKRRHATHAAVDAQRQLLAKAARIAHAQTATPSATSKSKASSSTSKTNLSSTHTAVPVSAETPFARHGAVMLVGEGNFSFARALVRRGLAPQALVATSFDAREAVCAKYADAEEIMAELQAHAHVRLLHSIDARQLHTTRALDSVAHVDAICFNFPHEGRGVKDEAVSVRRHQQLMRQYLQACVDFAAVRDIADSVEIMVTVKRGEPYNKWGIVNIARNQVQPPLILARTVEFDYRAYPGYSHRRTRGYSGKSTSNADNDSKKEEADVGNATDSKKAASDADNDVDEADGNNLLRGSNCCTYVFKQRDDAAIEARREERRRKALARKNVGHSHGARKKQRKQQMKKRKR